ncbi:MAG: SsrA-binding protein SmpB [Candidatus Methylomirabilia bacterium]
MARSQGDRTAQERVVATNRRAWYDYEIQETYEAGLVLRGTEVKSLREGKANLKESYARVEGNELWLVGCHISPYHHGTDANHDPDRTRKLLLARREINRLMGKTMERGLTLIPLRLYFTERGRAKLELGLARGKRLRDKRRTIREREARQEIDKALRGRVRGTS